MSAVDRAKPHGYSKAAKHARRHVQTMDAKQDHTSKKFTDPLRGDPELGATTVPGYYAPKNEKHFRHHPREKSTVLAAPAQLPDDGYNVAGDSFPGFERDLEAEDMKRWEKRRQHSLQEQYDRWLSRRFDIANPTVAKWLERIEPEFWDRRWAFLQDKMELETFLTRIRLYGPRTREDFDSLYALWVDGGLANAALRPMHSEGNAIHAKYTEGKLARPGIWKDSKQIAPYNFAAAYQKK